MKSLFSRLRHGRDTPPPSRPSSSQSTDKPLPHPPTSRSSSYSGSEDIHHSIAPVTALHSQSSSSSSDSIRPRSVVDIPEEGDDGIDVEGDVTIRVRTVSAADVTAVKKVTFRSPIPTPTTSLVLDEIPAVTNVPAPQTDRSRTLSSTSRQPAGLSPVKKASFTFSRPASNQSRPSSRQSLPNSMKPIMTRKSSVPSGPRSASPSKSIMSPAPSEQSLSGMSTRSYLAPPNSWSEMAEDDLIANLSPRERTRQEVLWEIVSSEERYVQELVKLNDTFCRNLLPLSATSPSLDLFDASNGLARTLSPALSAQSPSSPTGSFNNFLPIAAQYATGVEAPPGRNDPRLNAYHILTNGRPGEGGPPRKSSSVNLNGAHATRPHQSLPPPRRDLGSGGHSIAGRMSYHPGAKGKHDSRATSGSSTASLLHDAPIPDELEKVLRVLANGILEGHIKLAAALRKRYENQYPLVRSLADVFTSHSYILREYATYVLHLERALEQVDNALSQYTASLSKRASRRLEETEIGRLGKTMLNLEEVAAERGESGLVISLSKPFQRLLKYPLLFQNLLFNTDPSLKEYEATLAMVDEVEEIVRTIEDEKASSEEREKTRDVWARIEGLERDKFLMAPKPNRLLISEAQCPMSESEVKALKEATSKQKKSFRRLSDILKGSAESADLWIVRFSDVSLLCERTGMTTLPVSNFKATRSDSLPDLGGRSKFATAGKRASSVRPRNLYKFVQIHEWHLKRKTGSTEGLLEMEEISRVRSAATIAQTTSSPQKPESPLPDLGPATPHQPLKIPLKGDGGPSPARSTPRRKEADTETMVSDRLSVMSFAFKGSDQVKPVARRTNPAPPLSDPTTGVKAQTTRCFSSSPAIYPQKRTSGGHVAGNAANAKFAHRLRSTDAEPVNGDGTVRPGSRSRKSLPPAMALSAKTDRSSPALSPTERNGNTPRSPVVAPPAKGTPKTPSIAPSTRESVRGLSGATSRMETSVTGSGRRVVPKAITQVQGQSMRPSASTDSGVAGMWTAYRDGGAVGTPSKRALAGRSVGGKI